MDKTGRRYIDRQYGTDRNLVKRMQIHRFGTNPETWTDWLNRQYGIRENDRILEIGCGNGAHWEKGLGRLPRGVSLTLSDISEGMIRKTRRTLSRVRTDLKIGYRTIDADTLPFADASFDLVLAHHMLYHVRNLDRTLDEIGRVLKPGGRLYAATIGRRHMKRLSDWVDRFKLPVDYRTGAIAENFGLENGRRHLRRHFRSVRLKRFRDELAIPSIDPVLTYLSSLERPDAARNRTGLERFQDHLEVILRKRGRITIPKDTGLFIATK